jgi:glycosyltransferase involved in cell wall biosynthesis
MAQPLLTAIVSTYKAERFIKGCLDNLVRQTVFKDIEVIVVDSGSPQDEAAVCAPFVRQYPNIRYVRTEREGLYAAWNRAIAMSRGEFISNANTDDRHRTDAYEVLTGALMAEPTATLAYGDQYISTTENETFEECDARGSGIHVCQEYSREDLLLGCMTGSQPVWRRSSHQQCGQFDPALTVVGDRDFWLRLARLGDFVHLHQPLGVFYTSTAVLSASNGYDDFHRQDFEVMMKHLRLPPWRDMTGLRTKVAKQVVGVGYHFARRNQMAEARRYFTAAWSLDPLNPAVLRTLVLRGLLQLRTGLPSSTDIRVSH